MKQKKKTTSLLSLNDKCLEKIFGYMQFDHGQSLVEAFEHRLDLDPVLRNTLMKGKFYMDSWLPNFENVVVDYGSQLTNVIILDDVELITLLSDFCIEGRLRKLQLFRISITDSGIIARSKAMLSQLTSLKLFNCGINDDNLGHLLAMCPNLEFLLLEYAENNTLKPFLEITSKTMKSIRLNISPFIDRSTLITLLDKHPKLRRFECAQYYGNLPLYLRIPTFQHSDIICMMMPELEETGVQSEDIGHLVSLEELKKLRINLNIDHLADVNNYLEMSSRLQFLTIICDFQWDDEQFDGLIDAICTCTTLLNLSLNLRGPNILTDLIKLAKCLPLLESLKLQTSVTGDSEREQIILLEFTANAKRLTRLWVIDNQRDQEAGNPNLTDFTDELRDIVGRREQIYRKLNVKLDLGYDLDLNIYGSHIVTYPDY